ncbi:response regulator [Pigmentiphaga aceris]|uniref:histidine kinase n=1 Tax=Pigmentiphaga aceris TaxID=1940612 RepID=A0A5C0B4T6_9BURK|nr:hybrid sensor histidine kinase/response regulator [Pigmentiphaga aceris]QEI08300.1 response regulator [Pigmentiphaga aceris]
MAPAVKILVVDDIEQNLIALDALVARPDLILLKATSGAEALELLLEHDVALALVDVQMPGMDGFELAEFMRGSPRTRHVPIIFLTATDRSQQRTFRGYEAGAVDFLYKPFDPHILRSKLQTFVQLHAQKLQLAEQLEVQQQLLRTNELFVAVLGHDLRTPLAAVMTAAEVLSRIGGDERVLGAASRIRNSTRRMTRMVNQLLDLARVRAGQVGLQREMLDMGRVCRDIVDEISPPSAEQRVSVDTNGDTLGYWDVDRISQVLSNLIGNALQHGDPGQMVSVHIDGSQSETLRLSVQNAGIIPPEKIAKLFEPFQSGAPRPANSPGLGLGLYIANELVRVHGGSLSVCSGVARGTVFEMMLPRKDDVERSPVDLAPAAQSPALR